MTTYLMTGATGFLGRHVSEVLDAENAAVIPWIRTPQLWHEREWAHNIEVPQLVTQDVTEPLADPNALPELDGIFHLGALVRHSRHNPEDIYQTNIEGTLNMVRLAAEKKCRLIFVSTSGTVGVFPHKNQWADEHSPYQNRAVAKWPYYDSKIKAEKAAIALAKKLGVEMVIIRPPVLLGPGDHRFRSTSHIIRYVRGKLPFLIQGGMHFVDIRDAAQALLQAMQISQPRPVYHLSGVSCSIDSFFRMVERASGVAPPAFHLPQRVALAVAQTATGAFQRLPGDKESPLPDPVVIEMASKYWDVRSRYATQDLGFRNRYGQDTIDDTVKWLMEFHPKLRVA